MLTDPIADLLTQIRNGIKAHKDNVTVPFSKMKKAICDILTARNFIKNIAIENHDNKQFLIIHLAGKTSPTILKRISKPGQRIYLKSSAVKRVYNGFGIGIYSTSRGILSDDEVRKLKLGGEYICEIF